jgi:hypothetical protein
MTDYTISDLSYRDREAIMRANQEKIVSALPLILLALGVGVVLAVLFNPGYGEQNRKSIQHAVEDRFAHKNETPSSALKRLEKEFSELRHKVEDRIHDTL